MIVGAKIPELIAQYLRRCCEYSTPQRQNETCFRSLIVQEIASALQQWCEHEAFRTGTETSHRGTRLGIAGSSSASLRGFNGFPWQPASRHGKHRNALLSQSFNLFIGQSNTAAP
jgi:hypothetical protein